MQKYILHLISVITLLVVFLALPQTHLAVTLDKELIQELHYNQEEHLLTGRTAPSANVSFTEMVAEVVADEEGNFTLPIPAGLKISQIRIDDYIGDRYLVIDYDFEKGAIAEASQSTSSQAETITTSREEIINSTATNEPVSLTTETSSVALISEAPKTKQSYAGVFWLVLGVIIVAALASGGFYYYTRTQKQAENEVKPEVEKKQGRRKRRRRRKRKNNKQA